MKTGNPARFGAAAAIPSGDSLPPNVGSRRCLILPWLETACWVAGVAALAWVLFVRLDTHFFQVRQSMRFEASHQIDVPVSPVRPGDMVGELSIPRIGLSAVILEGDDDKTLRLAIGHIPGTAFPNSAGTVGLAAHRDTFFRHLGNLRKNDVLLFETREGTFRYRVTATAIVHPEQVEVLRPTDRKTLSLVTCYPFHFVGPAPQRFVVTASQIR